MARIKGVREREEHALRSLWGEGERVIIIYSPFSPSACEWIRKARDIREPAYIHACLTNLCLCVSGCVYSQSIGYVMVCAHLASLFRGHRCLLHRFTSIDIPMPFGAFYAYHGAAVDREGRVEAL